jgi:hypothetical protein
MVVAIALIGSLTYFQGQWSHRWSAAVADSRVLAARISDVPLNVCLWEGTDEEVTADVIKVSGAAGHLSRMYKNKETGDRVRVWLICGRPSDMIIHNPQICYPGQGYRQMGTRLTRVFESKKYASGKEDLESEFFTAVFRKESHHAAVTDRVYWAFASGPEWKAPLSTRLTFPGVTSLYKLYLTYQMSGSVGSSDRDPAVKFGEVFIPVVNEALFLQAEESVAESEG